MRARVCPARVVTGVLTGASAEPRCHRGTRPTQVTVNGIEIMRKTHSWRIALAGLSVAADGDPSTPSLAWPSFTPGQQVMSLVPPQPQVWAGFSDAHHCQFWAAG